MKSSETSRDLKGYLEPLTHLCTVLKPANESCIRSQEIMIIIVITIIIIIVIIIIIMIIIAVPGDSSVLQKEMKSVKSTKTWHNDNDNDNDND